MLRVDYFDGRSARAHAAVIEVDADGATLSIAPDGAPERRVALADVRWAERQRHGTRSAAIAERAGGGALQAQHAPSWDAFVRTLPRRAARDGWVVQAQQSWRATSIAVALLVGVIGAGYRWGVPAAARGVVALLPPGVERSVGELALAGIDGRWLGPSQRPAEERRRIEAAFARLVERAHPEAAQRPAYALRFHSSRIGPNAFALPGGTIVLTDELLELMAGRDDAVLGVLAHELGHVQARHGMRMLVQVSLLGAATGVALGDFSSLLAAAPVLVGQMAYSRDAEREADAASVRMLLAGGVSPAVMVEFFERAQSWRGRAAQRHASRRPELPIAFSSHPADAERITFFKHAAQRATPTIPAPP